MIMNFNRSSVGTREFDLLPLEARKNREIAVRVSLLNPSRQRSVNVRLRRMQKRPGNVPETPRSLIFRAHRPPLRIPALPLLEGHC